MLPTAIVAVYSDGGVIQRNPSPIGGTWAWCAVDKHNTRIAHASGVTPAPYEDTISNNVMEFIAAVRALESLPDGWTGTLYSDSQVTLGRLCQGWKLTGLPLGWIQRGSAVIQRLGTITPILLQGHPTKADLERGIGAKRGYPVSEHNVWCDQACQAVARQYLESRAA